MIRLSRLLGAAAVTWLALAGGAGAADVTLRFGTINAVGTPLYEELLVPFARALEEKSGQRLAVDIKPLGGYGRPAELFGMVEKGEIEIISSVQGYQAGRFPRTSVVELPLIYDSAETGTDVLWKLFEEGQLGPEYDSVKVLALYVSPPFGLFVAPTYKVGGLRDLRGLRLRTPGITIGFALSRLGVIPIGLPPNMIGPMLHDQLIDGMAYSWDVAYATRTVGDKLMIDLVDCIIDANLAGPALMVVMNRKAYEALPAELRQVIDGQSGRTLSLRSARMRDEADAKAKQRTAQSATHHIVKLDAAERRELEQRITPVYDEWVNEMKRDGIDGAALLARARALAARS
jgi:TRAP-type C4-dicarboxylate transport system substrate-binding protein